MADQTHVLFVEDDDVIREATQLTLERDGFAVTAMPDGLSGLEAFRADRPDIALLDVMVPGLDGVSLCRRIRDESTVPVIMLSARADAIDVVLGLEAGADDYVTKPFDGAVLVARIRAVLRRFERAGGAGAGQDDADGGPVLSFGELEIDTEGMEVRKAAGRSRSPRPRCGCCWSSPRLRAPSSAATSCWSGCGSTAGAVTPGWSTSMCSGCARRSARTGSRRSAASATS